MEDEKSEKDESSMREDLIKAIKEMLGGGMAGNAADKLGGRGKKIEEELKKSGG